MSKTKKVDKSDDMERVEQLCQMLNSALEAKGTTPGNLVERIGGVLGALQASEKKHALLREYFKA